MDQVTGDLDDECIFTAWQSEPQSEPLALVKPKPVLPVSSAPSSPTSNKYYNKNENSAQLPFPGPTIESAFTPCAYAGPILSSTYPVLPVNNVDWNMYHLANIQKIEHFQMFWNLPRVVPGEIVTK